ncbi:DNA repair protein RecN [Aestuariibius insulae]|uniref:DNA repair protein RecN n=1 Tax=Aestuariibius insulae TaxID=2058287 RepID=UPI00345E833D
MLRGLDIRDMLIIDRLELRFQPGLNVLTGETGAGKSILLDALGFVLGWRGRAELVRAGAEQGEATAWFDLADDHPVAEVLEEAGIGFDGELILRRVNARDGRKTAWVNDRRVSGEVLRALSDRLVELHGQQDDRGLLDPRGHRALLDQFAGVETERKAVRAGWKARREAMAAVEAAELRLQEVQAEEEFLRHAVSELDALNPEAGEEATLDTERRLMQAAEKIREDIRRAEQALGLQGAEGQMTDGLRWLEGVAGEAEGRLDAPLAALERAMVELGEAQGGVVEALEGLSFDAHALENTEERLFAIRGLARKHGVAPDDLGTFAEEIRAKVAALESGAGEITALRDAAAEADEAYRAAALTLSGARRAAASRLDAAMAGELAPLKMERAIFSTEIAEGSPGPEGIDDVAFVVATNPGAPAGPLAKIASGGELSRFLLALKVCLTGTASGLTLIFDEIDRGVGGATADAVGRRLASLAEDGQVLVVTHSPQVAARGGYHWRVEKRQEAETTLSTVTPLEEGDRVDEIARMISGDRITEAAREAARVLIEAQ